MHEQGGVDEVGWEEGWGLSESCSDISVFAIMGISPSVCVDISCIWSPQHRLKGVTGCQRKTWSCSLYVVSLIGRRAKGSLGRVKVIVRGQVLSLPRSFCRELLVLLVQGKPISDPRLPPPRTSPKISAILILLALIVGTLMPSVQQGCRKGRGKRDRARREDPWLEDQREL